MNALYRGISVRIGVGLLILLSLALAGPTSPALAGLGGDGPLASTHPTAEVTTGALNVRAGPGVGYQRVAVVAQGQTLALLGRNSDSSWVHVRLATGVEGWVNAALVQSSVAVGTLPLADTPAAPTATGIVATGVLNVRSGPGVAYGVVAAVYQGHHVTLLGRNYANSWLKVRTGEGREGWVNAALIQANVAIGTLPLADGTVPPSDTPTGVVNTGALNVRTGPGITYSIVATVVEGDNLTLLGRHSDSVWVRVRTAAGQEGWVNGNLLRANVAYTALPLVHVTASPEVTPLAVVYTSALNVRSGPGVQYGIVTVVSYGQFLTLLGRNSDNSWVQARTASGVQGWVNASFVQANITISSLPVTATPETAPTGQVATYALNVRSGPGAAYSVVTVVSAGQTVSLLGRNNAASWLYIRTAAGVEGWVNAAFLQTGAVISSLPVR